jgi:hypothetical protein
MTLAAVALSAIAYGSMAMALQSVRQSTTIDPGEFGTSAAKCRSNRRAVAGGFAAPGFDPVNAGPIVGRLGSKRVGDRQIVARALNFGAEPGQLLSFAYCARRDHDLEVRSATTRVEPSTQGSAVARCPQGKIAVAGGFGTYRVSLQQGPQVLALTSKRLGDRSWKVAGVNISTARAGTLIAHAYCQAAPFELITRSKDVTPAPGQVRTFDIGCPDRTQVFSGGFDGRIEVTGSGLRTTAAIASRRASGGSVWRTSTLSAFGTSAGQGTGFVYCKR